jgi:hypothetical protein
VHSIFLRIRWTLGDLGPLQSLVLIAAPLTAVVYRRRLPGSGVVLGWMGLTLVVLATSSNVGTGFGLPLVSAAIALGGAVVFERTESPNLDSRRPTPYERMLQTEPPREARDWRRQVLLTVGVLVAAVLALTLIVPAIAQNGGAGLRWPLATLAVVGLGVTLAFRPSAAVLFAAVIAVGFAAEATGGASPSWLGPPYRRMAIQSMNGARAPNIDALHRKVARAIAGQPTLLVRDDDLLNANGLWYTATTEHLPLNLITAPYGNAQGGVRALADAQLLIVGTSPWPYHDYIETVEAAAARDGWREFRSWSTGCGNTVDLWQKERSGKRPKHPRQTTSPYERTVLADAPAAYWRLDNRTCNAADAAGHNNGAIAFGQPESAAALIAGSDRAIHLDGDNDQIVFSDSPSLRTTRAISIEAWVRPDDAPSSPYAAWQLVSKWRTALLLLRGGPKPKFAFALYDTSTSSYAPGVVGTTRVKPRTAYHVVGTYDGSNIRLYVNGSLAGTFRYRGRLGDSPYGGALAGKGWGQLPSPRFHGTLDEVAVYTHALTPARIEAHYRVGKGAARR